MVVVNEVGGKGTETEVNMGVEVKAKAEKMEEDTEVVTEEGVLMEVKKAVSDMGEAYKVV